jgi:hypothetical protein
MHIYLFPKSTAVQRLDQCHSHRKSCHRSLPNLNDLAYYLYFGQCSKNRPIYRLISRLIVNRWVSDKIIAYHFDLSSRPIYQSDSRYFGRNIPNFTTYSDLAADLLVRKTIFFANYLVEVYISSIFAIFVDWNARNQGNTFVQYSNVGFASHIFEILVPKHGIYEKMSR